MPPPRPRRTRRPNGGGRQPRARFLDQRRLELFRYDATNILHDGYKGEVAHVVALVQSIVTRGSRNGIEDAEEFIRLKEKEALLSQGAADELVRVLDRYTVAR